jgi:IS605 OrfB family transposase
VLQNPLRWWGGELGFLKLLYIIFLVSCMQRAILLQTDATKSKLKVLHVFSTTAIGLANNMLDKRWNPETCDWVDTSSEFHQKVYSAGKLQTSFNTNVVCDIIRSTFRCKAEKLKRFTVKFNVPRNCKTFSTKVNFFVELGLYSKKRIAIPIKQNRNYQRFASLIVGGWMCKTYGLTSDGQVVAYLNKEKEIIGRKNILGIDVNAKHFAVSVISPNGKVLHQDYFGKEIWIRRRRFMERRALLQRLKAGQNLKRMRKAESDFIRTNLGLVVRKIILMAKRFDADIAIERLERFKPKGRKTNRIIMRIPFYRFRSILEQRCFDHDVHLKEVSSRNTSRWCSHCGALGNGHESSNYSLFRCKKCKQVVNSDRKASLAIAVKTLLERNKHTANQVASIQISSRRVPVNGLLCSDEAGNSFSVRHNYHPMESTRL